MLFSKRKASKFKIGTSVAALIFASFATNVARADNADLVLERAQLLEKELAAVKKENEALRHIKRLRDENASLAKSQTSLNAPRRFATRNPSEAFAADIPLNYKAAVPVERGQLKLWGEGGAIWSGGDPIYSFFNRTDLTGTISSVPGFFALKPKLGWEAASGFDYRFSGAPWHVTGQLRYGEGKTSAAAAFAQTVVSGAPPITTSSSNFPQANHKETHWLADMALGRDVFGSGSDAMQFKFGVRVAELRAKTGASNPFALIIGGITLSAVTNAPEESRFLGAGPRFGIDGSVPMGTGWTFDYLGDVAALFGTQKYQRTTTFDNVVLPPVGFLLPPPVFDAAQKFGTVFNADFQIGVSYWLSQNMKISASYRLDAFFNVLTALDTQNDPTRLQRIDRYIHGPRLAVTAQF